MGNMECQTSLWTRKTLCLFMIGTTIVGFSTCSSSSSSSGDNTAGRRSSGDDTDGKRSITCWCSTAECSTQHVSTCSTLGACYLQHRREAAEGGVLVTRGCMEARASSSLLCMNRPPKLGAMGAGWPSLHCCSRDRCNSMPPQGMPPPGTSHGGQTSSSPSKHPPNGGGDWAAVRSSSPPPSLRVTSSKSWRSRSTEGPSNATGPSTSLLDRFGALSPEDLSARLLKLAGEHQTGPSTGGRGPHQHQPYTGSMAVVGVLTLTAVLVVVTVYWYTREWVRPDTCKQWVLRDGTRKDWGRNMAGDDDSAGKIPLV